MSEELDLLGDVIQRLNSAGIEYMLTGSMALAIYSSPRMTRDIDIIIQVYPGDTEKILQIFQRDFYIDENSVRQAIQSRGMFNIIHNESIIKVDFIIRKDDEYRIEEFSRKQTFYIKEVSAYVVSVEDLVLSKLIWAKQSGSELQLRDVRQILTDSKNIDSKYLSKWSGRLGVRDLLERSGYHE